MMRVITGSARGVRLSAPKGETTRPTAERVKEAVFSMIQFETEGRRVLDLFAGSGQMGIEALSRGAQEATFVDQSGEAAGLIRKNLSAAHLDANGRVFQTDFRMFLRTCRARFDLIFLDPPYALRAIPEALDTLVRKGLLIPGALIVCETGSENDVFAENAERENRFAIRRKNRYGISWITLLEWKGDASDE